MLTPTHNKFKHIATEESKSDNSAEDEIADECIRGGHSEEKQAQAVFTDEAQNMMI